MSSWVSKIGLGTVQFGLDYGISNKLGKTKVDEVKRILNYASSNGITIIDTAQAYGDSESVLGSSGVSNDFKVVSKFMPSATSGEIAFQFYSSCNKLKATSLYAYLAHRPLSVIENPKEWDDLKELQKQKKINRIGFSLNAPFELEKLLDMNFYPEIIQAPYNYFDRRFEPLMIELSKRGCEIHTRSTFLQGLFFMQPEKLPDFFDEVKPHISHLQNKYTDLNSVLLKYVMDKPFIDKVIIGVDSLDQLKKNVEGIEEAENIAPIDQTFSDSIITPSLWPKR